MLRFKPLHRCSQHLPLVDIMDFNHNIKRKAQPVSLVSQLGPNYESYRQSSYLLQYVSHTTELPHELRVLSHEHPSFKQSDRIFRTLANLRHVRELETPSLYKFVNKEIEDEDVFPLDSLAHFKPRLIVDNLTKNDLVLFNIPLNCKAEDIQEFVLRATKQKPQVKVETCSLNLNSHAILSFDIEAEQFKEKLNLRRLNGVLMECKSVQDTGEQNPWDRTIVISNLNRSLNFQEILHKVGHFGRVLNAVIPLEISNVDYQFEDEVLQIRREEPIKLEVLDVVTGQVSIRFHPSEEEFMRQYGQFPEYYDPNLEQTVLEFQNDLDERENQLRLYRILTQKTVKCLRVPDHLKASYKQLWIPPINVTNPKQDLKSQLFNKTYINRGYCLCTFSSKSMAQRALHAINQQGSIDLAQLPLPLLNNPDFEGLDNSHSKQELYGARFRVENLFIPQLRAIKAWEGMELYQVDLIYNLKQLEKIRTQAATVKDEVTKLELEQADEDKAQQKRQEELSHVIYRDLSKNEDFKKFVEDRSFTKHSGLEMSVKTVQNPAPGRRFDLEIQQEEYDRYIQAFRENAKLIGRKQRDFASTLGKQHEEMKYIESQDPLMAYLKRRMVNYSQSEPAREEAINKADSYVSEIAETQKIMNSLVQEERKLFSAIPNKEELRGKGGKSKEKPVSEFSTATLNPHYVRKQQHLKHERFLKDLKRILLGQYSLKDKLTLLAVHPYNMLDQLIVSKREAVDVFGAPYLSDEVIQYVRQFDIREGEQAQVKRWEENRKNLLNQLSPEQLTEFRNVQKQGFTQNMITYVEKGVPTETFEITDEASSPEKMIEDLNNLVALANERYEYHEDPLTKKKYIVKMEKPHFKCDISVLGGRTEAQLEAEALKEFIDLGFTQDQALGFIEKMKNGEDLPDEVVDLMVIDKDLDPEVAFKEYGIKRSELEVLKHIDFRNSEELENEIAQQVYLKSIALKHSPLTEEQAIRDHERGTLNVKDKKGKFIVPKYKKY